MRLLASIAAVGLLAAFQADQPGERKGATPATNPVCRPNKVFDSHEDLSAPGYREFRKKYELDQVVQAEPDELKRILLLRNWLHRRVKVDPSKPEPGAADALRTLDEGPQGGRYHCSHMSVALNPVLNSMGHVSRIVFAGAGEQEPAQLSGSHGANEVWCNQLCKWILVDAEHDSHFEKNGFPLSALEVRDEVLRDGARSVVRVKGPERTPQAPVQDESWGLTARTYAWVSFYSEGNRFGRWPVPFGGFELVLDDEAFRSRTWYRDGKKHWAYAARRFKPVDRDALEWTPNVLDVRTEVKGDSVEIRITSSTPNLREYQVRRGGGAWESVDERITMRLDAAAQGVRLRAINSAGISGPEHRLTLERK
jgi:hypothetical protein